MTYKWLSLGQNHQEYLRKGNMHKAKRLTSVFAFGISDSVDVGPSFDLNTMTR